eukprot:jgi/Orpsp1_1/1187593/evm.model.d7180000058909.1
MTSLYKSDVDDDIESLLKELELEQDTLPTSQKSYKNKSFNLNSDISKYNIKEYDSKKNCKDINNTTTDELNDILQELSVIDSPPITDKKNLRQNNIYSSNNKASFNIINTKATYNTNSNLNSISNKIENERPTSQRKAKCTTVCIGGQEGITIGNNQKSCSKLRCTSCDFNCIYFKDYEWSNNVNYLFFRNYVPNIEKLSKELIPKK